MCRVNLAVVYPVIVCCPLSQQQQSSNYISEGLYPVTQPTYVLLDGLQYWGPPRHRHQQQQQQQQQPGKQRRQRPTTDVCCCCRLLRRRLVQQVSVNSARCFFLFLILFFVLCNASSILYLFYIYVTFYSFNVFFFDLVLLLSAWAIRPFCVPVWL